MKERLQHIVQACKEKLAAFIVTCKTPQGRKKLLYVLAGLVLIWLVFMGQGILQTRQASYALNAINTALEKRDVKGLSGYFDTTNIMADFVDALLPLQAHFAHDSRNYKSLDRAAFTEAAQGILLQVLMNNAKPAKSPEEEKAPEIKKTQVEKPLLAPYRAFTLPTLFPLNILELLSDPSFTLQVQDGDVAIISIDFMHPTLEVPVPLKFLMERGLTSWTVTRLSNTSLVLRDLANALRAKKNAAITAFNDINKQVQEIFDLHFQTTRCDAIITRAFGTDTVEILTTVEVTNKGQHSLRAASLNITLSTEQGNFIGNLPVDFAKPLPAGASITQSWKRTVESAEKNAPLLFKAPQLNCTISPRRLRFDDGQDIYPLPRQLLNGL